mgnify:FL=1
MVLKTVNRLLKSADILEEALNIHHFQFATPVEKNYYYDIVLASIMSQQYRLLIVTSK